MTLHGGHDHTNTLLDSHILNNNGEPQSRATISCLCFVSVEWTYAMQANKGRNPFRQFWASLTKSFRREIQERSTKGYFQPPETFWSTHTIHHQKALFVEKPYLRVKSSCLFHVCNINLRNRGGTRATPHPKGEKCSKSFSWNNDKYAEAHIISKTLLDSHILYTNKEP